jgi:hypothetical protein
MTGPSNVVPLTVLMGLLVLVGALCWMRGTSVEQTYDDAAEWRN